MLAQMMYRSPRLLAVAEPMHMLLSCNPRIARHRRVAARALTRNEPEDDLLVQAGCPVPKEQQPVHELKQLQDMSLFDWATMPMQSFAQKLATVWLGFFVSMGMPVSAFTFDLHKELLQCVVAASAGSSFIVTVLIWRLYLGWQHVGDRLISATVEYEETGWYDGQVWVKTPQVLIRDRLLSNYTVKPALARLKQTLLGLGGSLAVTMLILAALPPPPAISSAEYTVNGSYWEPPAAVAASEDYYARVAKFEPWTAETDAAGAAGAAAQQGEDAEGEDSLPEFDMRSHMMLQ